MEQVGREGRALFVNDSKATNADAAEKALKSFHDIFWILGGKSKEGGIVPLRELFPRVAKAYLIGAATDEFAATLEGAVPYAGVCGARCGRKRRGGAGGAAVAGLCVLRPVSEFRSARRQVSRACRRTP